MKKILFATLSILITLPVLAKKGEEKKDEGKYKTSTFSGLKFRNIGPALTSGRIADIAVNPNNSAEYYVAVASGGVWKTTNHGTTYSPIFDGQGSYSIGCVTIDPSNPHTIWVGTGENNNQRSVAYGDGVYKSDDGGKSWINVGLKKSEHIGKIIVHPTNSNIVYVAAYGPLWSEGGDRGLYKTEDGGKKWTKVLEIDEHTGISDIVMDSRNPDIIYAAAHQRRRHTFTYVGGGPGSGIHKTIDGGKNWDKLTSGLPSTTMGRIGLAISPVNPDYVFAMIEAEQDKQGFYRSTNRGASWTKMSKHKTSGNYYQEIICDPVDLDKVFSMDTWLHHTEDGGKTFQKTGEKSKHVDNHCIWINPNNTNHWIVGCDGGLYETWDHAANWQYKPNLPVTQYYKVAVDNAKPFYNVYGGTQDNNSMGGPSRTTTNHGIMNSDWYITNGGDGFESAIDPIDPNIVYAQAQYGWLVRYDKATGERVGIQPQPKADEDGLRWNWDAPLIISPHNNKRLYFAANKLFKSNDQGNTWECISEDLTRQIDRNTLKVMGRVQSMDAVMKNKSTTMYGNIVALDESPKQEGLIYVGTDDGLIQITEDNGKTWKKISSFSGIPANTYVNAIVCSQHDANTVYAVFNNHKQGDFKPYILKSTDKGATWTAVQGNLPERGSVYDIAEDHVNKNLLFAGTEFGAFFSIDGGKEWTQLKAGLPTIAVRDLEIQKRENDLVLASFGRGFYILDDYSALRTFADDLFKKEAHIFPIKDGQMYIESSPMGMKGKSSQGESHYTAENPPIGVVITYLLNDTLKTAKENRRSAEAKLIKDNKDVVYPTYAEFSNEDNEEKPYLIFTITDEKGNVVRKMRSAPKNGVNRIVWDFRLTSTTPIRLKPRTVGRYSSADVGPLCLPGTYNVSIAKVENGKVTALAPATPFKCDWLNTPTLPAADKAEVLVFQQKAADLQRAVRGTQKVQGDISDRLNYIKKAVEQTPNVPLTMLQEVKTLEDKMNTISIRLNGDPSLSSRDIEQANSISDRIELSVYFMWYNRSNPTTTCRELYEDAGNAFEPILEEIKAVFAQVEALEAKLDELKAPYTPGRTPLPDWKME